MNKLIMESNEEAEKFSFIKIDNGWVRNSLTAYTFVAYPENIPYADRL